MPEMPLDHDAECLACSRARGCHFHGRSHQVADRGGVRIQLTQRHFSQDVALGEDSGDAVLVIHHRHGTDVIVEHFVNCIGDRSFEPYRRDFAVTKFQYAHRNLLRLRGETGAQETDWTHYDRGKTVVKKNAQNSALELLSPKYL